MKKLYICRGLPGSGKSTYARTLAPLVVEPDMFRYDEDNRYVFDSTRNLEVNNKAQMLCEFAMRALKVPAIAVTAAYTKLKRFKPYLELGRRYGYDITVVECLGDYGNVHDVPDKIIAQMKAEWEPCDKGLAEQEGVRLWEITDSGRTVLYTLQKEEA